MLLATAIWGTSHKWLGRGRNFLGWLGAGLIFVSASPLAWWAYGVFAAAFAWWFAAMNFRRLAWRRTRVSVPAVVLAATALFLVALELPWRFSPRLPALGAGRLYVIGDSISAGIETGHVPWPQMYGKMTGAAVTNLSRPGIVTAEAVALADKVTEKDSIVLVEIGGNDLLGGTPTAEFDRTLDALLTHVTPRTRAVVMMEIPLIPGGNGYGIAQRALAKKHGVYLVPKAAFIRVLGAQGSTLDGLHLGEEGAKAMVKELEPIIAPALRHATASQASSLPAVP